MLDFSKALPGDGYVEQGPIFIGGPDRCGKTTMRAFLVSLPNVSIPAVGSNLWTYFYGQYGDLRQRANFERCLDALLHYKHMVFLRPDAQRLRREFWQGEPTYARLFELFHRHYAEREGKSRWGDQTGLVERYADRIFAAYPGAKMIHMVRDPRDRYEASLALWPDGKGKAGGATARWLYSIAWAKRNQKRYPDRYRVVRFESMVTRPEETLRGVCAFLGEEYTPAVLAMQNASDHLKKLNPKENGQVNHQNPLSIEFIGRYRQMISKPELAFMQLYARRDILAYGYELDPIRFSPVENLHFALIDLPVNLVRMLSWRGLEAIQHNFPAVLGRKPARKMVLRRQDSKQTGIEIA